MSKAEFTSNFLGFFFWLGEFYLYPACFPATLGKINLERLYIVPFTLFNSVFIVLSLSVLLALIVDSYVISYL